MTDDSPTTSAPATTLPEDAPAPTTPPTADLPVADAPTEQRCPWCSALLPAGAMPDRCPSCNAILTSDVAEVPGLTEVESALAARMRRPDAPRRSRLLSWISGEVDDETVTPLTSNDPGAIAPPPRDVRREMLRLRLEAEGLTVAPDGSIEISPASTQTASADPADADAPTMVADDPEPSPAADETEIRRAS